MNLSRIPIIILAGGKGKRLNGLLGPAPKPMMDIDGYPFIHWMITHLNAQGFCRFILATGHYGEYIETYFSGIKSYDFAIEYSREKSPLGTGGAIKRAITSSKENLFFIVNGDTFFDFKLSALASFHFRKKADFSIALFPNHSENRYGNVKILDEKVTEFAEKSDSSLGLSNAGVYLFNRAVINYMPHEKFNFETETLPKLANNGLLFGKTFQCEFLDIGTPESMVIAQNSLPSLFKGEPL